MALVSKIFKRRVHCLVFEDIETAITAIKKGYSPIMRHLPRVHGISPARLNELLCQKQVAEDGCARERSTGKSVAKDGCPRERSTGNTAVPRGAFRQDDG